MPRQDNGDAHLSGTLRDSIEIINLKPQQNTIPVWSVVLIGNRPVMMLSVETVQLQHKLAMRDQLFISAATMVALTAEQTLIPSAACFHIGDGN